MKNLFSTFQLSLIYFWVLNSINKIKTLFHVSFSPTKQFPSMYFRYTIQNLKASCERAIRIIFAFRSPNSYKTSMHLYQSLYDPQRCNNIVNPFVPPVQTNKLQSAATLRNPSSWNVSLHFPKNSFCRERGVTEVAYQRTSMPIERSIMQKDSWKIVAAISMWAGAKAAPISCPIDASSM